MVCSGPAEANDMREWVAAFDGEKGDTYLFIAPRDNGVVDEDWHFEFHEIQYMGRDLRPSLYRYPSPPSQWQSWTPI